MDQGPGRRHITSGRATCDQPFGMEVAARKWLEKNGLVTILKPGKVSPYFRENLCQY
jgi:hypothetical protein